MARLKLYSARLGKDDRGATAIEYGLIVAFIALAIIASVRTLGEENARAYNAVHDGFNK